MDEESVAKFDSPKQFNWLFQIIIGMHFIKQLLRNYLNINVDKIQDSNASNHLLNNETVKKFLYPTTVGAEVSLSEVTTEIMTKAAERNCGPHGQEQSRTPKKFESLYLLEGCSKSFSFQKSGPLGKTVRLPDPYRSPGSWTFTPSSLPLLIMMTL